MGAPFFVSGQAGMYFEDQFQFFCLWPMTLLLSAAGTSTGGTGPYSFNFTPLPILQNQVIVSDAIGHEDFTDVPIDRATGNLVGSNGGSGTVNYLTGAMSWTYGGGMGPPAQTQMWVQAWPYNPSKPFAMNFYNTAVGSSGSGNTAMTSTTAQAQVRLRPVPDEVYRIEIQAQCQPVPLINDIDIPVLPEWWQMYALGAATHILEDRMDMVSLAQVQAMFENQINLMRRRTWIQVMETSSPTIFNTTSGPYYLLNSLPYGV